MLTTAYLFIFDCMQRQTRYGDDEATAATHPFPLSIHATTATKRHNYLHNALKFSGNYDNRYTRYHHPLPPPVTTTRNQPTPTARNQPARFDAV